MAYQLELSDLPPRYRAQAEAQLAGRGKKRGDTVTAAARVAAMSGLKFDSRGEYEYYVGTVAPKVGRGEIVKWEAHPCFLLFPAGEYNGVKLRSVQYTADATARWRSWRSRASLSGGCSGIILCGGGCFWS